MKEIERLTNYTFFYNNGDFDLKRIVSVAAVRKPVSEVVRQMLPDCSCRFENRRIILVKDAAPQRQTVKGVVKDEKGAPVIGATVLVTDAGQTRGISTDMNGSFTLTLPALTAEAMLEVSFIGFDTYKSAVGSRTFFDVVLTYAQQSIDEVVVVGYGVQKKANLTGAVATVSQKELKDRPVSNVGRALQGVIPNLNVTLSSGQPGAGATYNIRGTTSPNGGSPLVLIDGVETYPDRINSNDIESITVLKDASSAAIYGARGAFGVILITTKSGKYNEKAEVSYNGYFSVSSPTTSTDYETRGYYSAKIADFFMMATQNTPYTSYTEADYKALWERRNDKTENPARPWVVTDRRNGRQQYVYLANFDWYNYLYDDSRPTWDHNINIKGGTKALSYMVSGRYYQQKGVNRLKPDMFRSYNFRVKLQAEIKPWLTIASNTKFFQSNYKYYGYEDEYNNFRKPTLHALASFVPVNPDGTAVSHTSMTQSSTHYVMDGYNAMMQKGKSFGNKKTQEITTTFEATFKLHKNFNIKADFSYTQGYLHNDYRSVNVQYSQYPGEVMTEPEGSFPNKYKEVVWDQNYYVADVYGTYNRTFAEKHNLTLIAGYNYEAKYYRDLTAANDGLLSEDLSDFNLAKGTTNFTLNGGRNEYAIMGWFYRAAYDYKGKYLAEVSGRYDGSSKFPTNSKWGFFPSASVAWRVSEEPWMKWSEEWLDNFKIRLSAGSMGNGNVSPYSYTSEMTVSTADDIVLGGSYPSYTSVGSTVPVSLTWEKSTTYDVGLDLDFFNNRLSVSGDYYRRYTTDMYTASVALPAVYGTGSPKGNNAEMKTDGWELSLSWRDSFKLGGKPFDYSIKAMVWDSKSVITKYVNDTGSLGTVKGFIENGGSPSSYYVGMTVGEIWGYTVAGLFRDQADIDSSAIHDFVQASDKVTRPGQVKIADLDHNGNIDPGAFTADDHGDLSIIGNINPHYMFGVNLAANWNGIGLSVFLQGVMKRDWYPSPDSGYFWGKYARPFMWVLGIHNYTDDMYSEEKNNWDTAYWPRMTTYQSNSSYSWTKLLEIPNTRYKQNAAYLRVKNIQVDYTFPKALCQKIRLGGLKIYLSGENLFTFTPLHKYAPNFDPEALGYDTDFSSTAGDGYTYPVLKSVTLGVNITF